MKQFTVSSIVVRAEALHIVMYLEGDTLKVLVPPGLPQREKALEVIREHKAAVVEYLRSTGQCWLCSTCLDQNIDTPADLEHEGLMYCPKHWPGGQAVQQEGAA